MSGSPDGALEIDHLVKHYGSVVALSEMTFSVGSGELFGFVGSNGAGKTTTMRIVMGVLAADSGRGALGGAAADAGAGAGGSATCPKNAACIPRCG